MDPIKQIKRKRDQFEIDKKIFDDEGKTIKSTIDEMKKISIELKDDIRKKKEIYDEQIKKYKNDYIEAECKLKDHLNEIEKIKKSYWNLCPSVKYRYDEKYDHKFKSETGCIVKSKCLTCGYIATRDYCKCFDCDPPGN